MQRRLLNNISVVLSLLNKKELNELIFNPSGIQMFVLMGSSRWAAGEWRGQWELMELRLLNKSRNSALPDTRRWHRGRTAITPAPRVRNERNDGVL